MADAPEDALLRSARALRRMGARLTRLDPDELALEARLSGWGLGLVMTVRGVPTGANETRLSVECTRAEPGRGPALGRDRLAIARFRATLARTDAPSGERR